MQPDYLPTPDSLPPSRAAERIASGRANWRERLARLDKDQQQPLRELTETPKGKHLLESLFGHSPFLAHCLLVEPLFLMELAAKSVDSCFAEILATCRDPKLANKTKAEVETALRQAKRRAALVIALADISGQWPLLQVTAALSELADASLDAALAHLLLAAHERGDLVLTNPADPLKDCGYAVIGMGKYGARELNYSSDIDIIPLYQSRKIDYRHTRGVQEGMVRLTRDLVRMIDERTSDGYVFRTDLRLRPDPGATPLCLSLSAALTYYESQGQNWERAAMIKARAVAGDRKAGEEFLEELTPFIWRKHLDFWAIQDIHSIKRQIQAHKGGKDVAVEGHNIKLGRGGIREIEFFAQTQQLIFGGRDFGLREPRTLDALSALRAAERITPEEAEALQAAYSFLRTLEHRLQMVDDQQTHSLPDTPEGIRAIAQFMGFEDPAAFRQVLLRHLRAVEEAYAELFEEAPSLAGPGNLVFTGGEPEPGTLATLETLGFKNGERVFNLVRTWHHGRYRATRSVRSRQILTELMPALLQALGKGSDPDSALGRFDTFLSRLPAGVQLFSLLYQNPALLETLAEILGSAPALADRLARQPILLDAVLDTDFYESLPDAEQLRAELEEEFAHCRDFQDKLDAARRWAADYRFRVGVQILRGTIEPNQASRALSDLADAAIALLLPAVEQQMQEAHGRVPGAGLAVVALGRLGAREMTLTSDLDLVFVYDCDDPLYESDGPRPIAASLYFGRLAQRLIAALSAPTGEGALYEVDPRLRPSGASGPIALSLKGYRRYLEEEAWTWELMALTRFRLVAGESNFVRRCEKTLCEVLSLERDPDQLLLAVDDMRRRIAKEYPGTSLWDIKYTPGGLYDLDFIAQYLQLRHAAERPAVLASSSDAAFADLAAAGLLPTDKAEMLRSAGRLWRQVQNYLRLTSGEGFDPAKAAPGLREALARAVGMLDFDRLESTLQANAAAVRGCYEALIAAPAQTLRNVRDEKEREE
jgi:glutamate-ammonia-ligase adenylyltransferase